LNYVRDESGDAARDTTAGDAIRNPKTGMPPEYRISARDTLGISLVDSGAPFVLAVHVRPDGTISLPLLNDVLAVGFTAAELRDVLAAKLEPFIANPRPSVIIFDRP
jgi:polysaccharide export outer membrane protein